MSWDRDRLAKAGYEEGGYLGLLTDSAASSQSTTNNTYSNFRASALEPSFSWDTVIPTGGRGEAISWAYVDPSTDLIDVRLFNADDSEVLAELTGISGGAKWVELGPVAYTPTTSNTPVKYRFQFRNGDNATSVSVFRATISFGLQL